MTNFRVFDAKGFGLAIDVFGSGALIVNSVRKGTRAVQQDASAASRLVVDVLLATPAFLELFMLAGLASGRGEEKRATIALSVRAISMSITVGGMHTQADGARRHAIGVKGRFGMGIEGNSGDATMTNGSIIDVPCVISSIGSQMGRVLMKSRNSLAIDGTKEGDVALVKRLGQLGEGDLAIVGGGRSGDA